MTCIHTCYLMSSKPLQQALINLSLAILQLTLASNYFGPIYLTYLLLDVLKASAPSRVVYEASLLEQWGHLDWNDLG